MAAQQSFTLDIGTDWLIAFTAYQFDGVTIQDLTGSSLLMQISNAAGIVVPAASITATIAVGSSGTATLLVPRSVTKTLAPGSYDYAVRMVLPDGTYDDQAFGVITAKKTAFFAG